MGFSSSVKDHAFRRKGKFQIHRGLEAEQPIGKQKLLEEFSGVLPPGAVERMYAIATAGKHDFMYINLVGKDGPECFAGFDKRMIYNPDT